MNVTLVPPVVALLRQAREEPGRVCLVADGRAWTCAELVSGSGRPPPG
jgi:hypothetical protein